MQRRQYTRVKYVQDLLLKKESEEFNIKTIDISAGGLKFTSKFNIDIDGSYEISIPVENDKFVSCIFQPLRIEKSEGVYTISGQFFYKSGYDKMLLTQYCEKRSVEIKNK